MSCLRPLLHMVAAGEAEMRPWLCSLHNDQEAARAWRGCALARSETPIFAAWVTGHKKAHGAMLCMVALGQGRLHVLDCLSAHEQNDKQTSHGCIVASGLVDT